MIRSSLKNQKSFFVELTKKCQKFYLFLTYVPKKFLAIISFDKW